MLEKIELKVIPIFQLILCSLLAWGIKHSLWGFTYHLEFSTWLSIIITFIAICIGVKAIVDFKQHNTTVNPSTPNNASILVNSGIFAYSRNPMYLAMVLVLLAFCLYLENALSYLSVIVLITYVTRFQIVPEERALINRFGDNFKAYKKKVRRWL